MTDKPKLEPCPFCKSIINIFIDIPDVPRNKFPSIQCWMCNLEMNILPNETLEDLIIRWNTRTPTDFEVKAREFFEELAFRGPSSEELFKMANTKFDNKYESLGNFMLGEDKQRAKVILKVRKFLEENP